MVTRIDVLNEWDHIIYTYDYIGHLTINLY